MTPSETTAEHMNDIADSLDEAAMSLDESMLSEGGDLKEFASKTVYSTFYYFSYGVCFVGYLAGKVVPKGGVVGQGLRDGAEAAQEAVDRITTQDAEDDGFGEPVALEQKPKKTARKPAAKKTATTTRRRRTTKKAS